MIFGAGGTIFALPYVEQNACSGQGLFGTLAQLNKETQKTCAENRMLLWGAVALGIVGIGLLVAGAVLPKGEGKHNKVGKIITGVIIAIAIFIGLNMILPFPWGLGSFIVVVAIMFIILKKGDNKNLNPKIS